MIDAKDLTWAEIEMRLRAHSIIEAPPYLEGKLSAEFIEWCHAEGWTPHLHVKCYLPYVQLIIDRSERVIPRREHVCFGTLDKLVELEQASQRAAAQCTYYCKKCGSWQEADHETAAAPFHEGRTLDKTAGRNRIDIPGVGIVGHSTPRQCPCCNQSTSVPHTHPLSWDGKQVKEWDGDCSCNQEAILRTGIRRISGSSTPRELCEACKDDQHSAVHTFKGSATSYTACTGYTKSGELCACDCREA